MVLVGIGCWVFFVSDGVGFCSVGLKATCCVLSLGLMTVWLLLAKIGVGFVPPLLVWARGRSVLPTGLGVTVVVVWCRPWWCFALSLLRELRFRRPESVCMTGGGVAVRVVCLFGTSGGAGLVVSWFGRGSANGQECVTDMAHGGSALSAQPDGTVILRVCLLVFRRLGFGFRSNRRLGVLHLMVALVNFDFFFLLLRWMERNEP